MKSVIVAATAIYCTVAFLNAAAAQDAGTMPSQWVGFGEHQFDHEFESDIDSGGSLAVTRARTQAGILYMQSPRNSIGVALRYGYHGYDFGGTAGFGGLNPWGDVREWAVGVPYRLGIGSDWDLMAVASVQGLAEYDASWDESVTASGILTLSYRVSDDFRIGPGLGIATEIEDDVSVFPFLLIDWQINDVLSLSTRGAERAVNGPQAVLSWQVEPEWSLAFGAGREELRFRLDDSGVAPGGVGQGETYPVFASLTYGQKRGFQAFLFGGYKLGGELTLEDSNGTFIAGSDYDDQPFLGVGLRMTW